MSALLVWTVARVIGGDIDEVWAETEDEARRAFAIRNKSRGGHPFADADLRFSSRTQGEVNRSEAAQRAAEKAAGVERFNALDPDEDADVMSDGNLGGSYRG